MEKTFNDIIDALDLDALRERIASATPAEVERALAREHLDDADLPALFSPAASPYLEDLAQRSAAVTERRFGRVVQLYVPLYLGNECVNKCTYCGFSHELEIPRLTLTPEQVEAEGRLLHAEGFRHILLVAGEDRRHVGMEYLKECVRRLNPLFEAIAIEIQPLEESEYRELVAAGVDGLAIYQETYDERVYRPLHLAGPKRNFRRRIESIEAGGSAGMRTLGIAALLGLNDWRVEATLLALHGRYLTRRFWRSRVAVSFPRIRKNAHGYNPDFLIGDAELVQMICAMRLALPDAELVMSTREPAWLRDRMIGLGITRTSAGSKTNPGGYSFNESGGEQFDISDPRGAAEVAAAIAARGFEPVWKDFDRRLAVGS